MGDTWGDIDADGDLDVLLSNTERNTLLYQEGGFFADVSTARGVEDNVPPRMPWGAAVVDADNDGWPDAFVASSYFATVDEIPFDPWWYRQQPDGSFVDHAADLPSLRDTSTRGVVSQDVNDDGVPDLLVGGLRRSPWVFLSDGCTSQSWVELRGPAGSYVAVEAGGVTRAGLLTTESGWGSAAPASVHIGLGTVDTIDRITIRPPWSGEAVLEGPITARRRIEYAP
jgi:hypothetical protein